MQRTSTLDTIALANSAGLCITIKAFDKGAKNHDSRSRKQSQPHTKPHNIHKVIMHAHTGLFNII
eukprot:3053359-Amphidinium_carterae.1